MPSKEQLRTRMIENAAEINRLHRRIHETVKHRSDSENAQDMWSDACRESHARYEELCLPGGPYPNFYERVVAGEPEMVEVALCFLEVRPYFFRSGYHWETILQKCKRAPLSGEQAERFVVLLGKYTEWKRKRNLSSARGAAVRRDILSLLLRFYRLFPVKLPDFKFDGLVTVGDLYELLCKVLRIEPVWPIGAGGLVQKPFEMVPGGDISAWAREYRTWRERRWTAEDVWATLVATIKDVYQLNEASEIVPETILREPGDK